MPAPGTLVACELELDPDLPLVVADGALLGELVDRLVCRAFESIGPGWGTITLWTGIVGAAVGPIFPGDLRASLPGGHYAFLEVHDTGGAPSGTAAEVTEPFLSALHCGPAVRYATAERRLRAQGGELRLQSLPATGTSVVVVLPFASEPCGWLPHGAGRRTPSEA